MVKIKVYNLIKQTNKKSQNNNKKECKSWLSLRRATCQGAEPGVLKNRTPFSLAELSETEGNGNGRGLVGSLAN